MKNIKKLVSGIIFIFLFSMILVSASLTWFKTPVSPSPPIIIESNITNYWTTDTSQTGLTGTKNGSYNLITTGMGSFNNISLLIGILDWGNLSRYIIDTSNLRLGDRYGHDTVRWSNQQLWDSSSINSNESLDWNQRQLYTPDGNLVLDWKNRKLINNWNVTGNITAKYFKGDGSLLTGITGGSGGNPFDQSLNTTDSVTFAFINGDGSGLTNIPTFNATYDMWAYNQTQIQNPFDQSLNTTNNVTFNKVTTGQQQYRGLDVLGSSYFINAVSESEVYVCSYYDSPLHQIWGLEIYRGAGDGAIYVDDGVHTMSIGTASGGLMINTDGGIQASNFYGNGFDLTNLSTFNATYDMWSYNQSDGSFNATYDLWAYNQTFNLFDQLLNTIDSVTFNSVNSPQYYSNTNTGTSDCYDSALGGQVCSSGGIVYSITDDPSDKNLKSSIKNLSLDINKFDLLKPSEWIWNITGKTGKGYGLVAQDVQNIYPELVKNGSSTINGKKTNYQTIDYAGIIALQIKEIQKLKNENNLIKSELCEHDKIYSWCL